MNEFDERRKLQAIISRAVDMHVHVGPEVIPRKYTAQALAEAECGRLRGAVLKNHFYPTVPMAVAESRGDFKLYGAVVLNNSVGGLNPEAVRAAALITQSPLVVWFPTINSEQFLRNSDYEIPPEWVGKTRINPRLSQDVKPVSVTRRGVLLPAAKRVVEAVAALDAILATGHISWRESVLVANYAIQRGVRRIIVTHPIYQRIGMPLNVQAELAGKGCYMEQSFSMVSIDGISIKKVAAQIKMIGAKSVILSSDVGQQFSVSPSQALNEFAMMLLEQGISIEDIETMLITNPMKLLTK